MKTGKGILIQRLCVAAGILLLAGAVITLVLWRWNIHSAQKQAKDYTDTLRTLIPAPQDAVPEVRSNNAMPVLSVDGTDFVGLIEMPRYGSALPVSASWGKSSRYPCRFDGSIYDGSLQVGATTQKGQYDFYRELSVGDTVIYTDMEGNRYTLEITSLRYAQHADQAALQREDAPFTLFIKNIYAFEYLIVFCDIP